MKRQDVNAILGPHDGAAGIDVNVHRSGSGSFFGGDLRVLYGTSSPKNVPAPLSLH